MRILTRSGNTLNFKLTEMFFSMGKSGSSGKYFQNLPNVKIDSCSLTFPCKSWEAVIILLLWYNF